VAGPFCDMRRIFGSACVRNTACSSDNILLNGKKQTNKQTYVYSNLLFIFNITLKRKNQVQTFNFNNAHTFISLCCCNDNINVNNVCINFPNKNYATTTIFPVSLNHITNNKYNGL
jgi:hypothetical protein